MVQWFLEIISLHLLSVTFNLMCEFSWLEYCRYDEKHKINRSIKLRQLVLYWYLIIFYKFCIRGATEMFFTFTCMYFDFHLGTERRHLVCQNNQRKSFKTSRCFFSGCPRSGYYGGDCSSLCPRNCKGGVCDIVDGTCKACVDGFKGLQCNKG